MGSGRAVMSKGSRQRTYGAQYEDNYERIFRKASGAPEEPSERFAELDSGNLVGIKRGPHRPITEILEPGMGTSCIDTPPEFEPLVYEVKAGKL